MGTLDHPGGMVADVKTRRSRELFLDALELDAAGRDRFLNDAESREPSEVARARQLLAAHDGPGELFSSLDGPLSTISLLPRELRVGATLGPYTIAGKLGEGGFGAVYLAEQARPVRRRVALKVIHEDLRSDAALARFEAERHALARMEHPAIARVYDAATSDRGVPYIVMEYVPGEPVTDYCNRPGTSLAVKLELFESICRAVAHAHQRGVLHRDLKPSNVLIVEVDGEPRVKVIDFGVAKAIGEPLGGAGVQSVAGELIGTPVYMSPEQAKGRPDLDTRADVYALGALLYELLAGAPPFDAKAMGLAGLLSAIARQDPTPPSRRVVTSSGSTRSARIPADLDWITMRCLDKQRGRRYPTATALADDVRRFVGGRPVHAAPPSAVYQVRKWVRRHRLLATTCAALVLGGAGGVFGIWRGAVHARQERDVASAVLRFLDEDLLRAAMPSTRAGRGVDVKLVDAVAVAADRLLVEESSGVLAPPRVRLEIHRTLADLFHALGSYEASARHSGVALAVSESLGSERSIETLELASFHGSTLRQLGTADDARAFLERARTGFEGRSHRAALAETELRLAYLERDEGHLERARDLASDALARLTGVGDDIEVTVRAHTALGVIWTGMRDLERAEQHFRAALELEDARSNLEDGGRATAVGNVATCLLAQGRPAAAAELLEPVILEVQEALGAAHPDAMLLEGSLARSLLLSGRAMDAKRVSGAALERSIEAFGDRDPRTATVRATLAEIEEALGNADAALALARRALVDTEAALGPDAAESQARRDVLLSAMHRAGVESTDLLELSRAAAASRARTHGEDHVATLRALANVAMMQERAGQIEAAEATQRLVIVRMRRTLAPHDPELVESIGGLVDLLRKSGRLEEAENEARAMLAAISTGAAPADGTLGRARARLGFVLLDAERVEAGRTELTAARGLLARAFGQQDVWVRYIDQLLDELH